MAQVLGGFPSFTNVLQAPGVAGDFCSANPRAVALSSQVYGNTGFVAGTGGLTIGLFAWLDTSTYRVATNAGAGAPNCFVARDWTGLITTYLTAYGMTIPAGVPAGHPPDWHPPAAPVVSGWASATHRDLGPGPPARHPVRRRVAAGPGAPAAG